MRCANARRLGLLATLCVAFVAAAPAHGALYWAVEVPAPGGPTANAAVGWANLNGTAASPLAFPHRSACGVAVDDRYVYWGGRSSISRASLDGIDVDLEFLPGIDAHCALAVDHRYVYWASGINVSSIGRARLDGSDSQPNWITGINGARALTADADHVYWVTADGNVGRADITGANVNPAYIAGPGDAGSAGVAVTATHVYWSNTWINSISRAKLDGSDVERAFIVDPSPQIPGITFTGLAVDATHLYWNEYPGRLGRARLDGTGVEFSLVPATGGVPRGVAVDTRTITDQQLSISPTPAIFGQPLTLMSQLRSSDPLSVPPAIPTGAVTFMVDGEQIGPAASVNALGWASLSPSWLLDVGTEVHARYSGDHAFLPTGGVTEPTIRPAATSTDVRSSANPALEGGEVTVFASVHNEETAVTPFGSVTFSVAAGAASLNVPLDQNGSAGVVVSDLPAGTFPVQVAYHDDTADVADFRDSQTAYVQRIVPAATPTVVPTATATPTATPVISRRPEDTQAPSLTITLNRRTTLRRALDRGLPVDLRCNEPCRPAVTAKVDRTTARRLRLKSADVGESARRISAALNHHLVVRFSSRARTALRKRSAVRLTLTLRVSDATGNVSTAVRSVRLAR